MSKLLLLLTICAAAWAQDTGAVLEGQVTDASGAAVPGALVKVTGAMNGYTRSQIATNNGVYHLSVPAGLYSLSVSATRFAEFTQADIELNVSRTVRLDVQLKIAVGKEVVYVSTAPSLVDSGSLAVGNVVSGRELLELPLNGRNFSQLGLLQPGVSPLTAGLAEAGGSLRGGQAYAVNGQRPESNNYLLDGVTNVNRVDGGYALRTPVDAIQEFRILTETAPAEYGGTSGATTTVVTRSGSNQLHGTVYEFVRNDAMDARNFFAAQVEPLKQNQFGATLGGPLRRNKDFLFAYYEGFRNRQGITQSATVPSDAQRSGDFSGIKDPQTGQPVPLINYFSGQPFPDNRIPGPAQSAIARKVLEFYPRANAGTNLFVTTQTLHNTADQGGFRFDHTFSERDQLFLRYARSASSAVNPLSVAGANVPGFPVAEDLGIHSVSLSETHLFSGSTVNELRLGFFRNAFDTDKPVNRTPASALGFGYKTTLAAAEGPPFFIVSGYASVGDPITGPRDTAQNSWQFYDSLSHVTGVHSFKAGVDYRRNQINMTQGIASNGFFVFAPFPASDSFASFLLGLPGGLLPGRRRHEPQPAQPRLRPLRPGRMAPHPAAHAQLRPALGNGHALGPISATASTPGPPACNRRSFRMPPRASSSPVTPACPTASLPPIARASCRASAWPGTPQARASPRSGPPTPSSMSPSPTASAARCNRRSARCPGRRPANFPPPSISPTPGTGRILSSPIPSRNPPRS